MNPETDSMTIGDIVSFNYKGGRNVIGEITSLDNGTVTLKLHTNYFGKNDDWFSGENKNFNRAEMKDEVRVQWQCPSCGQYTSEHNFICCCSRECLKLWLDKTNVLQDSKQ